MLLVLLPCVYLIAYAILTKEDFLKADNNSISFVSHYPSLRRKCGKYQWGEIKYYDASIVETKNDIIYKIKLFGLKDELLNSVSFSFDEYTIEKFEAVIDQYIPTKESYLQNNLTTFNYIFTRKKSHILLIFSVCAVFIGTCIYLPFMLIVFGPFIVYFFTFIWAYNDKIIINKENIEIDLHKVFTHTKRCIPLASIMRYSVSIDEVSLELKDNDEILNFEHLGYRDEIKGALHHILPKHLPNNETHHARSVSKENKKKKPLKSNQTSYHERKAIKKKNFHKKGKRPS